MGISKDLVGCSRPDRREPISKGTILYLLSFINAYTNLNPVTYGTQFHKTRDIDSYIVSNYLNVDREYLI